MRRFGIGIILGISLASVGLAPAAAQHRGFKKVANKTGQRTKAGMLSGLGVLLGAFETARNSHGQLMSGNDLAPNLTATKNLPANLYGAPHDINMTMHAAKGIADKAMAAQHSDASQGLTQLLSGLNLPPDLSHIILSLQTALGTEGAMALAIATAATVGAVKFRKQIGQRFEHRSPGRKPLRSENDS